MVKKCHGKSQKCTGWTGPFYPLTLFTSALFGTKCPREGGTLNQFQYFDNHKGYVNEFLHWLDSFDLTSHWC